jgi:hypothetical protein
MGKKADKRQRGWVLVLMLVSVSLLWSLSVPAVTHADTAGAICILQVLSTGRVLSVLVDQPQNINIAVLVGEDREFNVPVLCDSLKSLSLALANQENHSVDFSTQVFTNKGKLTCFKDGFPIAVNGAIGITFADCP